MITKEEWDLLIALISSGLTNIDACQASGISTTAFYDKVKSDSDFSDSVKKASVKFKLKHLKNISDAASKNWQASAWILERKFKREFSRVEYIQELEDSFAGKTDEELNEIIRELEEQEREYELRKHKSKDSTRKEEEQGEE